ncbi:hypothetical protein SLEP1_g42187 [Rubroshorea leprosula]|uniref:Uncharacterized protein n=1 Tax=Rubroshorea leprosula TaxID=152421 RepID=A0AAV5L9G3_9ROSI|nr:hypothetical protein SLEP1_g42187 [Rubroshorea leprosula]
MYCFCFFYFLEDEEGQGWVFSADQMVDEARENEDSEWDFSHNPVSSIGQSNGNHDLAHSVLQLQINGQCFEDAEEMEHVSNSAHQCVMHASFSFNHTQEVCGLAE